MKIHAYIISYNEEKLLPFTLDYYSTFCEKIFVYDNYSTDSSDEIYKKYDKVEVIKWDSGNEINENNYIKIKSEEYRKYSRNFDVGTTSANPINTLITGLTSGSNCTFYYYAANIDGEFGRSDIDVLSMGLNNYIQVTEVQ